MLIEIKDKDHPDLKAFTFCSSIMKYDKDEKRPHMICLLIEDGHVVGTNGRVLRRHKLESTYDDGLYRLMINKKNHIAILNQSDSRDLYPDYKNLIEINSHDYSTVDPLFMYVGKNTYIKAFTLIVRSLPAANSIDPKYINDLEDSFTIAIPESGNIPVIFDNPIKQTSVMTITLGG